MPSTQTSTVSPGLSGPTPLGVPVLMTSPSSRVMAREMKAITRGIEKMNCLVTDLDPSDLEIKTLVNGEVKQHGRTSQFIFSIPRVIAYLSRAMTLEEGDVISTGTPSGVGPLKPGDTVEVWVEGIGSMIKTVEAESL